MATIDPYKYRLFMSTWGIYIDIAFNFTVGRHQGGMRVISPGIWLNIEVKYYSPDDIKSIVDGLQIVAGKIKGNVEVGDNEVIVRLVYLEYPMCDFQQEGLTAAVMECSARQLGFELPKISVYFDKTENRYMYDFSNIK